MYHYFFIDVLTVFLRLHFGHNWSVFFFGSRGSPECRSCCQPRDTVEIITQEQRAPRNEEGGVKNSFFTDRVTGTSDVSHAK